MHLILGDIHEKYRTLLEIEERFGASVDHITCVGDYFDSFANHGEITENTVAMCDWLEKRARDPKYTLLWGNHDLHYAFPMIQPSLACSGWNNGKQTLISARIQYGTWSRLKLAVWVDKWFITHAGIHPEFLTDIPSGQEADYIEEMCEKANADLFKDRADPLVRAGRGRGGRQMYGGVTWLDWRREFRPIPGINQIVGHTSMGHIDIRYGENSVNYNVDCELTQVLLIDNETVTVMNV